MRTLTARQLQLQEWKRLGFAWALGHHTLYKFKGFQGKERKRVLDVLRHSQLYCSSPDQFNDPYDAAPVVALAGDVADPIFIAELQREENKIAKKQGRSVDEMAQLRRKHGQPLSGLANHIIKDTREKLVSGTRILCLSAELMHPLQWSHYADSHRGVALHFRSSGAPFRLARQVLYRRKRKPILIPLSRQKDTTIFKRMVLVKGHFWRYEREYRIVAAEGHEWGGVLKDAFVTFDPALLTGITVGMRMPKMDLSVLLRAVDRYRPGLPIFTAAEELGKFWMKQSRIH